MAPKDFHDNTCSSIMMHHEFDDSSSSCSSSHSTESRRTKKSVSFFPSCYVKLYPMPTEEDRANAWYSHSEYRDFKSNLKATAKAFRDGKTLEGEEMVVGLESANKDRAEIRVQRRFAVWDIVMNAQDAGLGASLIASHCSDISEYSARDAEKSATVLNVSICQEEWIASKFTTRNSTPAVIRPAATEVALRA